MKKHLTKKHIKLFYKQILALISVIIVLFIVIGLLTTAKPSSRIAPSIFTSMTNNADQAIFLFLYSMENHTFKQIQQTDNVNPKLSQSIFNVVTSINVHDTKSFLSNEIPGFSTYENNIIVAGIGMDEDGSFSDESGPPVEDILQDRVAVDIEEAGNQEKTERPMNTGDKQVLFLYNSHNRESFLPHLPEETNANLAYHEKINITKVSERIAEKVQANGIGVKVDDTDIMQVLNDKGWKYGKSYAASRDVVEAAVTNKDVEYVFDIHRDSLPRERTTHEIDSLPHSKILFVIGAEYKNYEKNLKLATELHYLIEEKYPGLSKGVITKEGPGSNGVYNQDLHENAMLIEVGGHENTLDEMYRTADIIADVFSDFYWEAEKVSK